jgi:ParB-like chromosome segregation protein Spo0J
LPELNGSEFQELKADIRSRGLREAILVKNGHIVDGRHRYKACVELGIEPTFTEYEGHDIIAEIASRNLFRRNLTPQQRAALVVKMCGDTLAKEAHDRQTSHLKKGEQFPVALKSASRETRGETAERIAKLAKVGRDVAREALRAHKGVAAPRKKRSKPPVRTFEQQVEAKFVRLLESFPIAREDEVKQIILRILKKQPAGKTITL